MYVIHSMFKKLYKEFLVLQLLLLSEYKRPEINQLTPQIPWTYCAIPGDIGVRIREGMGEARLSSVSDCWFWFSEG